MGQGWEKQDGRRGHQQEVTQSGEPFRGETVERVRGPEALAQHWVLESPDL